MYNYARAATQSADCDWFGGYWILNLKKKLDRRTIYIVPKCCCSQLKGNWTRENICRLHVVVLSISWICIHAGTTFLPPISAPQGTVVLVCPLPVKSRKGWLVTLLALLPHIPALFTTPLIQAAAGHRIAVHTVMVLPLPEVDFNPLKAGKTFFKFYYARLCCGNFWS